MTQKELADVLVKIIGLLMVVYSTMMLIPFISIFFNFAKAGMFLMQFFFLLFQILIGIFFIKRSDYIVSLLFKE